MRPPLADALHSLGLSHLAAPTRPLEPRGNQDGPEGIYDHMQIHIRNRHIRTYTVYVCIVNGLYSDLPVETIAEEIDIPAVFTSYYASQDLRRHIIPDEG